MAAGTKTQHFSLYALADWDLRTINLFEKYLAEFDSLPLTKSLLNSMIKFKEMYPTVWANPYSWRTVFGETAGENEYRQIMRAQIRLREKDLLKAVDGHGGKRLVLTTRAHKVFYQDYPLAKLRKEKWDGVWVVVVYDFPEKKKIQRNFIRTKLQSLGFGRPQESVLVSPLPLGEPVQELVVGERVEDFVWVLSARRVFGLDNREVAARAWDLATLNDLYSKLLQVLPKVRDEKEKNILSEWQRCFLALDAADPYLPLELLPEDWQGERCRKEFSSLGFQGLFKSILNRIGN